jgi:hypothetical protein
MTCEPRGARRQVEKLEKSLNVFSDTLDEWMAVQKGWMYLESIFSAPDIQRQLPKEAKAFFMVDKQLKDIMRKVSFTHCSLCVRNMSFRLCELSRFVCSSPDGNGPVVARLVSRHLESGPQGVSKIGYLSVSRVGKLSLSRPVGWRALLEPKPSPDPRSCFFVYR